MALKKIPLNSGTCFLKSGKQGELSVWRAAGARSVFLSSLPIPLGKAFFAGFTLTT